MQFSRLKRRPGGGAAPAEAAGYTITEVAVVLTVMGLVVGGVLKAQEMIENARITATLAQVQQFRAAVEQFKMKYDALPGDFLAAQTYISGGSIVNGNGNGVIGVRDRFPATAGTGPGLPDSNNGCQVGSGSQVAGTNEFLEARQFWLQMSATGLLSGIRSDNTNDAAAEIGAIFPTARLGSGGGWQVVNCLIGGSPGLNDPAGTLLTGEQNHWFRLGAQGTGAAGGPVDGGVNTGDETNSGASGLNNLGVANDYQAYQLDRRFDDGVPTMGTVRTVSFGCGPAAPTGTPQDTYAVVNLTNGVQNGLTCVMYFRM
jgi:type II secretory pathway pseudopilin PulG